MSNYEFDMATAGMIFFIGIVLVIALIALLAFLNIHFIP